MHLKLPYCVAGTVVQGFGRGSKDLGCPTANFPQSVVKQLPEDFVTGVYFGWAQVDDGPIHKMVMNVGWCPFYNNELKSMETHILHQFDEDFYGSLLRVCILGYLRPEKNFSSMDELIVAIKNDVKNAGDALDDQSYAKFRTKDYFNKIKIFDRS